MTIEIREMMIKTVVTDQVGRERETAGTVPEDLADRIRADILEDCRDLVRELLEEVYGR